MGAHGTDLVPITVAAQLLETTEMRVLIMLKENEMQGKMVDEAWYVDQSSLNLFKTPKVSDIVKPEGCGICGTACGNGC